jgi:multiple antibiotic resistance protein
MQLTEGKTKQQILSIALRTSLNVLIILLISFFAGKYILSFFGISLNSVKIAGGLIIASSGFALLTGSFSRHKGLKKKVKDDALNRADITLTPLAIPMLAGPGTISLLITYNEVYSVLTDRFLVISSVVAVSIVIFILLNISRKITKMMGASGMNSLSRIIGFIVISIGIEFILSTILSIVSHLAG